MIENRGLRDLVGTPVIDLTMEDVTDWDVIANATISEETTDVRHYRTDKKSVKIKSNAAGGTPHTSCSMVYLHPSAVDISGCDLLITYKINPAYTSSDFTYILLRIDGGFANRLEHRIEHSSYATEYRNHDGWVTRRLSLIPNLASGQVGTWGLALTAFDRLDVYIYHPASAEPEVVIDRIAFVPKQSRPHIVLNTDDGGEHNWALANYLASRGIPCTFFIITSRIGTAGYLTVAQLTAMERMGHLIANHSYNHVQYSDPVLTPGVVVQDDIIRAIDWMEDNGFTRGSRIFATPYGGIQMFDWGAEHAVSMWGDVLDLVRSTGRNNVNEDIAMLPLLGAKHVGTRFDSLVTERMEDAAWMASNPLLCYGFHPTTDSETIDANGDITAAFEAFCDVVVAAKATYNADTVTFADLVYGKEQTRGGGGGLDRIYR